MLQVPGVEKVFGRQVTDIVRSLFEGVCDLVLLNEAIELLVGAYDGCHDQEQD
jgi:hypothetical protein